MKEVALDVRVQDRKSLLLTLEYYAKATDEVQDCRSYNIKKSIGSQGKSGCLYEGFPDEKVDVRFRELFTNASRFSPADLIHIQQKQGAWQKTRRVERSKFCLRFLRLFQDVELLG